MASFAERKDLGMIRECHGDLHLGNVVETEAHGIRLFDCIEYRAEFRWIDIISEIAFLTVDLEARDDYASAWHLLNRYLELSGDYHALWIYQGYQAYRAMVRAGMPLRIKCPYSPNRNRHVSTRALSSLCRDGRTCNHDSATCSSDYAGPRYRYPSITHAPTD